jgi:hypothetical protein
MALLTRAKQFGFCAMQASGKPANHRAGRPYGKCEDEECNSTDNHVDVRPIAHPLR